MWKPFAKTETEANPQDAATATSGENFEDVAKQFSEQSAPQPARTEEDSRPPKVRWWQRLFGKQEAEVQPDKLLVKVEWAQGALEYCFLPLAKLDHPAWALSPDEAQKGAPVMQAFLQVVADRLAPAILARVTTRYPEFTDLAGMLAFLYYQKWRAVTAMKEEEAKQNNQGFENAKRVTAMPARPVVVSEDVQHCEECDKDFPTREALAAHLPCPGKGLAN